FFADHFLSPPLHPSCFHHEGVPKVHPVFLSEIEQGEGDTDENRGLPGLFQSQQGFVQLLFFTKIESAVRVFALPDQLAHHVHQRRIRSFQIRRQKSENTILRRFPIGKPESLHETLFVQFRTLHKMPAVAHARGTTAFKYEFRLEAASLYLVRLEELDGQEGNLLQRVHFFWRDSQDIAKLPVQAVLLILASEGPKGNLPELIVVLNTENFIVLLTFHPSPGSPIKTYICLYTIV